LWPLRTLPFLGSNYASYYCPVATSKAQWTTNSESAGRGRDRILASGSGSWFSYGYNDWGVRDPFVEPQLGLGGDINPTVDPRLTELTESRVRAPSEMIGVADSRTDRSWDGNLDPRHNGEWPSNRHQYRSVLGFADGHSESPFRKDVVNPRNLTWRARWNNDNDPHLEISDSTWDLVDTGSKLDKN